MQKNKRSPQLIIAVAASAAFLATGLLTAVFALVGVGFALAIRRHKAPVQEQAWGA